MGIADKLEWYDIEILTDKIGRIIRFLDETIDAMIDKPRLWGSCRSVENQVMRLLETREIVIDGEGSFDVAGRVERDYVEFLRLELPGSPDTSLFTRVNENEEKFKQLLSEFCRKTRDRQLYQTHIPI